jgi:hypothetical protein
MSISEQSDNRSGQAGDEVLIHIRHLPSGEILTIDSVPPQLTAEEWRRLLLDRASNYYKTFANARGFFRLPRQVYNALVAEVTPLAAE